MESGTIEQTLPGLGGNDPSAGARGGARDRAQSAEAADAVLGPLEPGPRAADRQAARHRARPREAEDIRERRDVLSLRGVRPRRRHVHRAVRMRPGRPSPDGAPHHDQRGAPGLGETHHGCRPLVLLRAAGQEVAPARADHRSSRSGHAAVRRSGPRAHDGPSRRPGAGVLPHSGGSHDGDPALCAVRSRPQSRPADRRGVARHRAARSSRGSSPR